MEAGCRMWLRDRIVTYTCIGYIEMFGNMMFLFKFNTHKFVF